MQKKIKKGNSLQLAKKDAKMHKAINNRKIKNRSSKFWIAAVILVAIFIISLASGCSLKAAKSLDDKNISNDELHISENESGQAGPDADKAKSQKEQLVNSSAMKCIINNESYYIKDMFIYVKDNKGYENIVSPAGQYSRFNTERWQFRIFLNMNDSIYNKTEAWIKEKKMPNGSPIACTNTTKIPQAFYIFHKRHIDIFTKNLEKAKPVSKKAAGIPAA